MKIEKLPFTGSDYVELTPAISLQQATEMLMSRMETRRVYLQVTHKGIVTAQSRFDFTDSHVTIKTDYRLVDMEKEGFYSEDGKYHAFAELAKTATLADPLT